MTLLNPQEKNVKPVVRALQKKRKSIEKTIKTDKVIAPEVPIHVSKEEKAKAGKFVHLMERSDAYIHYRKNGKNSKIGEFDFRSLLLCTMESSRETLVKNMELFKGYAGIHDRQDLLQYF